MIFSYLAQRPPGEGQVAINAGRELADQPGAQQQAVARRLGLGGGLTQRLAEEVGKAHGVSWIEANVGEDLVLPSPELNARIEERAGSVKDGNFLACGPRLNL